MNTPHPGNDKSLSPLLTSSKQPYPPHQSRLPRLTYTMSTPRPCDGQPRVCPGQCNPRNRTLPSPACNGRPARQPPLHQAAVHNHNVYYQHEFSLFSRKTQTDQGRTPDTSSDGPGNGAGGGDGLNWEDRKFVERLTRRLEARKRIRSRGKAAWVRKIVIFLVFFFLHGCIAALARNYSQYQTFLATQFCGFITIMFWDDWS